MAFLNRSIKDSLKLINETPEKVPKKRGRPKRQLSPVRVPRMSPTPRPKQFSPFSTETKETPEPSSTQVGVSDSIKIHDTVMSEDEEESDDDSLLPLAESDELKYLESNFFRIIRILHLRNDSCVVCYDPNGQVVYIVIKDKLVIQQSIAVFQLQQQDYIEFPFACKEYFKSRIVGDIRGVIMQSQQRFCILQATDNGDIAESFWDNGHVNECSDCSIFCFHYFEDLKSDLESGLGSITHTYHMIQQYQLILNKDVFKSTMEEIGKLSHYFEEFDKLYQAHTNSILTDWGHFNTIGSEYIHKQLTDGLSEDQQSKFKCVALNLFARFQSFNKLNTIFKRLQNISTDLQPVKHQLKAAIEEIENDSSMLSSKILEESDLQILL